MLSYDKHRTKSMFNCVLAEGKQPYFSKEGTF